MWGRFCASRWARVSASPTVEMAKAVLAQLPTPYLKPRAPTGSGHGRDIGALLA